ncbi:MAG TPA: EscN/YscN/HrcN family type III secretion system ATPase, partial [Fimbriimonadaceae bacterium]|nr:EscN/YscN/HrcN family type III secretion system ATPase [Fimbriimonadaceae bacterium]
MIPPLFKKLDRALDAGSFIEVHGTVSDVVGLVIETDGPNAAVGDVCQVRTEKGPVPCEVVGFRGDKMLLMPLGELAGVRAGDAVRTTGEPFRVATGDALRGRVLDGLGRPMDDLGPLSAPSTASTAATPPRAMTRALISKPLTTGVRAIDGLLTLGQGQRMGIFAGSGVGKSTLLGMIARNCIADVNVICLVG